jgi:hypothetical protein
MTNKEIRALANEKRKTVRGLVPVILAFYGVMIALEFVLLLPEMLAAQNGDAAPAVMGDGAILVNIVALVLFTGLMGGAGMARAAIGAWRTGRARIADLFCALTSLRGFLRALAPALLLTVLMLVWMLILKFAAGPVLENMKEAASGRDGAQRVILFRALPLMYGLFLGGIALGLGSVVIGQLYFAIHLWPEAPIHAVVWRGCVRAVKALGRAIGMGFMIVIKPLAIYYGAMLVVLPVSLFMNRYAGLAAMAVLAGCALLYLILRLIPYILLAFAGLETEVFGEDGKKLEEIP